MSAAGNRNGMGWGGRLVVGLLLIIAGAAAATWGLAHSDRAARLVGVSRPEPRLRLSDTGFATAQEAPSEAAPTATPDESPKTDARIATVEQRLRRVEAATERTEGSVGRADGLVVAFAARRAIDRGVALGYLEKLLVERFGARHPSAVATIVTGARHPVRLNDLIAQYDQLGPMLRSGTREQSFWTGFKRELGSLIQVRNADRPSPDPNARYDRAVRRLQSGDVDQALAETMRMPGAAEASDWIGEARRYVAVHRALDEIESAALMPNPSQS